MKSLLKTALMFVSLTSIINCSNVSFSTKSNTLGSLSSANPSDGSVGGGINQGSDSSGAVTGGGSGSGSTGNGGPTAPGSTTGGTSNTGTGTGSTAAYLLPKVKFIGPPCERLSNCEIEFRLDKAYSEQTEFNWRTDDQGTICSLQPPTAPLICARANYHYVPNYGRVVFPAGTTSVKVFVKNINPDNVSIRIDVLMSQCQYGNLFESCSKFFN